MKHALISILVVALVVFALLFFLQYRSAEAPTDLDTQVLPESDTEVTFMCDEGKSIFAGFSDGLVSLTLSDTRAYTLEQVESASGARYANDGEAIVFWTKGEAAFLMENGDETFSDCIVPAPPQAETYQSDEWGITFRYPETYLLREREAGTDTRPQHAIVLVVDTAENRAILDGASDEPREGPTSITIDIYENPESLSPEEWARVDTNWNIGSKTTEVVSVNGTAGVSYQWDGLYQGKSAIVTYGARAYVFSVTWLTPEDDTLAVYDALLATVNLSSTYEDN